MDFKDLNKQRVLLRKRENELWDEKFDEHIIPEEMFLLFGKCMSFDKTINIGSFEICIVLSDEPIYIFKNGFEQKNILPDGCLRIQIECNTADGVKRGFYGRYSMKYADLVQLRFEKLEKNAYNKILTMSKLDYSVYDEKGDNSWVVEKHKDIISDEIIQKWKDIFD